MNIDLYYSVGVMDMTSAVPTDPTTDNPSIRISVKFKGIEYVIGNTFSLAELRLLSGGDTTAYRAIETQTQTPNTGDTNYPIITEQKTHLEFNIWAQRYPNSGIAPIVSELPIR
tara:strand:+ start:1192 stop:1533 length:342 start_codon:yes stop_codon:yes gene_type:complete